MTIEESLNHYYKHNLLDMGEGVYIRHIQTQADSRVYNWFYLMQNDLDIAQTTKITKREINLGDAVEATLRFFYTKDPIPKYGQPTESNMLLNNLKFLL